MFSWSLNRGIPRGDETTENFCSVSANCAACGWLLRRSRLPRWESAAGWRFLHELIECVVAKIRDGPKAVKKVNLTSPLKNHHDSLPLQSVSRGGLMSSNQVLGNIRAPRKLSKVSDTSPVKMRNGRTGCEVRADCEERVDTVTVAATSRIDWSRVIDLLVNTPASAFTHFARCLLVSSGLESTMFVLAKWYMNEAVRFDKSEAYVLRACGDSLICPFSKGIILPVSRCKK